MSADPICPSPKAATLATVPSSLSPDFTALAMRRVVTSILFDALCVLLCLCVSCYVY